MTFVPRRKIAGLDDESNAELFEVQQDIADELNELANGVQSLVTSGTRVAQFNDCLRLIPPVGGLNVLLPAPSVTNQNGEIELLVESAAGNVIVAPKSGPINGALSLTLSTVGLYTFRNDATGWYCAGGVASGGSSLIGSTTIVIAGTQIQRAALTGDVTAALNSNATSFRSFGAGRLLYAAGIGVPTDVTFDAVMDAEIGSGAGTLAMRSAGGAGWVNLGPGTAGLPLVSNGVGSVISYQALAFAALPTLNPGEQLGRDITLANGAIQALTGEQQGQNWRLSLRDTQNATTTPVNNYTPAGGMNTIELIDNDPAAAVLFNGLVPPTVNAEGKIVILTKLANSDSWTVQDSNAGSTAANQFRTVGAGATGAHFNAFANSGWLYKDAGWRQLWWNPGFFRSDCGGFVTASGGGTANFLRADGGWAAPPGSSQVGIVGSPIVANQTATAVATNMTNGAFSILANLLAVGTTYRGRQWLNFVRAAVGSQTIIAEILVAGTVRATATVTLPVNSVTYGAWIDADFTCRTTGAAGTGACSISIQIGNGAAANQSGLANTAAGTFASLNTTIANNLEVRCRMSAANAGDTITLFQGYYERLSA